MNVYKRHLKLAKKALSLTFALLLLFNLIAVGGYADVSKYYVQSINPSTIELNLSGLSNSVPVTQMDIAEEGYTNVLVWAFTTRPNEVIAVGDGGFSVANWRNHDEQKLSLVRWVVQNGYPNKTIGQLESAAGLSSLSTDEVILAMQAAIWFFTENVSLDDSNPTTGDVNTDAKVWALYNYFIDNVMAMAEPSTNSVTVVTPNEAQPANAPVGPITFTHALGVKLYVNSSNTSVSFEYYDGSPVDMTAVESGRAFRITGFNNEYGSTTLTVQNEEVLQPGQLLLNDDLQALIVASYIAVDENELSSIVMWRKTIDFIVHKSWVGPIAGPVEVNLLADGQPLNPPLSGELNEENEWTYVFKGLRINNLDEGGYEVPIVYSVEEVDVPDGYKVSYPTPPEGSGWDAEVRNTYEPDTTRLIVEKSWADDVPTAKMVDVEVVLKGTNIFTGVEVEVDRTMLNESNSWTHTFDKLPSKDDDGHLIKYDAEEILPDGYVLVDKLVDDVDHAVRFINGLEPTAEFVVKKDWDSVTPGAILPDIEVTLTGRNSVTGDEAYQDTATLKQADGWVHTFEGLPVETDDGDPISYDADETVPDGYVLQNKVKDEGGFDVIFVNAPHIATPTSIAVEKEWLGVASGETLPGVNINLLGTSTSSGAIVVNKSVTLSSGNSWRYTFAGLPVTDTSGSAITYDATEDVPTGFNLQSKTYDADTHTFTFVNAKELISLKVVKVWQGGSAGGVTVKLLKNGTAIQQVVLSDSNNWQHVFTNLPKYESGVLLNYSVLEEPLAGYTTKYSILSGAELGGAAIGFKITNSKKDSPQPELTSVKVMKAWQGGVEDSATVKLLKNGTAIQQVVLSDSNNWQYVFTNLPKYESGALVNYTVVEEPLAGYTTQYSNISGVDLGSAEIGYLITNIKDTVVPPEMTTVKVVKKWQGEKLSSVIINLYRDGVKMDSVILSDGNNWTHSFDNLVKYNGANLYEYRVDEEMLAGYSKTIEEESENHFVITNYKLYDDDEDDDQDDDQDDNQDDSQDVSQGEPQQATETPQEGTLSVDEPEKTTREQIEAPTEPSVNESSTVVLDVPTPLSMDELPKTNEVLPLLPQLLGSLLILAGAAYIVRR